MLDLVISGGLLVDGTGAPGVAADIGVRDGRVVAVGSIDEAAARHIDARGLVVAPGFIDVHTHYDAQLVWDPSAQPSCLHGVTTVIGGNCGFTLAPLRPTDADYTRRLLAQVEGMPLEALESGVEVSWQTFGEYLDQFDGRIGVNAGFLVGHSALRRHVMGADSTDRTATAGEVAAMVALLGESLAAGGLGFSSSASVAHTDGDGAPVPSRRAERDELLALAAEAGRHPGTTLEFITTGCMGQLSDIEADLMGDLSAAADRPLNWNVLVVDSDDPASHEHQLAACSRGAARGGRVVGLSMPAVGPSRICFGDYIALFSVPGWKEWYRSPHPDKVAALSDRAERRRLDAAAHDPAIGRLSGMASWGVMTIGDSPTGGPAVQGRSVGELAAERRIEPIDFLFDLVVADDLRTVLWLGGGSSSASTRAKAEVLRDPRVLVGGSDAGAHLDRMCMSRYPTRFLSEFVRDEAVMAVEEVVHLMTGAPARYLGLRDRGVLRPGAWADIVVFDLDRVGAGPIRSVADLPGGNVRLTSDALGIEHVLVNGVPLVEGARVVDTTAGHVLRSGRDTDTVTAGRAWVP